MKEKENKTEKFAIGINHWYNLFGISLLLIKELTSNIFLQ